MKMSALVVAALALLVSSGPRAFAEVNAFGSSSQDLWIPAQAFAPMNPGQRLVSATADFYLSVDPPVATGIFSAPLTLEAGARISRLQCDFRADVNLEAHIHLRRQLQPPGDVAPFNQQYLQIGMNIDHTYQTRLGTSGCLYLIDVEMGNDGTNGLRFRGCRVIWSRQVSPAPATATFNDVPVGHPLHRFVEALVAAGITGGCGGGQYCPDAPLTRGQMAVFLSVALGLHFPN